MIQPKHLLMSAFLLAESLCAFAVENTPVQFELILKDKDSKEFRKEIHVMSACDQMRGVYFSGSLMEAVIDPSSKQRIMLHFKEPQSCETKNWHGTTVCSCDCPEGYSAMSNSTHAEGSPTIVQCLKAEVEAKK